MSKGQIKMTETIGVLFVFLVLVIFGFLFYARFQSASFQSTRIDEYEKRSVEVAQRALNLPELQCSSNNIVTDNCIDTVKLDIFSQLIKTDERLELSYFDKFQASTIKVKEIYPSSQEWTFFNRSLNTSKFSTQIPISLFDPGSRTYSFGIMNLTYYVIVEP